MILIKSPEMVPTYPQCGECGGTFVSKHQALSIEDDELGTVRVGIAPYLACDGCGEHLYPFDTWGLIDDAIDRERRQREGAPC